MKKRMLNIFDLENFYSKFEKNMRFSSEDTGYQIVVQVPMNFDTVEESDDGTRKFYDIRAFHLLTNRNGSSVPKSASDKAIKNLAYKPVLANFVSYIDPDTKEEIEDFSSHDIEWIEDENNEEGGYYKYIERQIGCFTADKAYYEETKDKTYIRAKICIPNEYTSANSIIERKKGTKMSVELSVNELQYDAKNKVLELTDFDVQGITCLGVKVDEDGKPHIVEEGMQGAGISLEDFSSKNNSLISNFEKSEQLIKIMQELKEALDNYNKNDDQKGGEKLVNKFDELLEKYGITAEDVTFDYEGLTDEELEAKFEEVFGKNEPDEGDPEHSEDQEEDPEKEGEDDPEDDEDGDDEPKKEPDNTEEFKKKRKCSIELENGEVKTFEVSLDEKIYALQDLVNATYSEADNTYYGVKAYESYVVMMDYWYGRYFKQSYSIDGDNYSLTGDRVEVYATFVTEDEQKALDDMRSNYSVLEERVKNYESIEMNAKKEELLASNDYSAIKESEAYEKLNKEHESYSYDELKTELDSILLSYAKSGNLSFAAVETAPKKKVTNTRLPFNEAKKKSRYGSLFSKEN